MSTSQDATSVTEDVTSWVDTWSIVHFVMGFVITQIVYKAMKIARDEPVPPWIILMVSILVHQMYGTWTNTSNGISFWQDQGFPQFAGNVNTSVNVIMYVVGASMAISYPYKTGVASATVSDNTATGIGI